MGLVRLPDGSLGMETPGGAPIPWALGDEHAQRAGFALPPLTDPRRGALAFGDSPEGEGGRGNVPESRADVPAPSPIAQSGAMGGAGGTGGVGPQSQDQGGGTGAPAAPEMTHAAPGPAATTEKPKEKLRGGAEMKDIGEGSAAPRAPSYPRAHLVKGQDVRASYQESRENINPEDVQAAEAADADASIDKKLAAQRLSDTSVARSAEMAQNLSEQADAEKAAMAHQAQKNQAVEAEYVKRQNQIDQESEAIKNMPLKSAAEVLGDRGLGTKLISGLSLLAGGALQGMHGGDNPALKALNQTVEAAVQNQREKRDARLQGLHVQQTQLERLQQMYGTPEAAEAALRDRMRGYIQVQAQKSMAEAGVTDAPALLQSQFADWDRERAQSKLGLQKALAGNITEHFVHTADQVVGGPPVLKPADQARIVRLPDGSYAAARTEAQAKEVQDKLTPASNRIQDITELRALLKQMGTDATPERVSAVKQRIGAISGRLVGSVGELADEKRENPEVIARRKQMLGSPDAIIRGEADAAIEETLRGAKRESDSIVRDYLSRDLKDPTAAVRNPDTGGLRREP